MKKIALILIKIYRNTLSKMKIRACRYYPSCSEYTYTAIEKYGLLKGVGMGLKRLLRCNPFAAGGYDPLP